MHAPPVVERMLTVGREAIVLRGLSTLGSQASVMVQRRFQKWKQLYSCDRNPPAGLTTCVHVDRARRLFPSASERCPVLLVLAFSQILTPTLLSMLSQRPSPSLIQCAAGACLNTHLSLSNHHGHSSVYDTYPKRLRRR